jgi:hypothetical protein
MFVEGFLGSGPILRHKKPAKVNWGVDIDPETVSNFTEECPGIGKIIV